MSYKCLQKFYEETQYKNIIRTTFPVEHENSFLFKNNKFPFNGFYEDFAEKLVTTDEDLLITFNWVKKDIPNIKFTQILIDYRSYIMIYDKSLYYEKNRQMNFNEIPNLKEICGIMIPTENWDEYSLKVDREKAELKQFMLYNTNAFHSPSGIPRQGYSF
jgi:hypothetical protein